MEKRPDFEPTYYTVKLGFRNSFAGCFSTRTSDQTCIQVYRASERTNYDLQNENGHPKVATNIKEKKSTY